MPVVVNEFEVVAEPEAAAPPPVAEAAVDVAPDPLLLERVLRELRARDERVRAH